MVRRYWCVIQVTQSRMLIEVHHFIPGVLRRFQHTPSRSSSGFVLREAAFWGKCGVPARRWATAGAPRAAFPDRAWPDTTPINGKPAFCEPDHCLGVDVRHLKASRNAAGGAAVEAVAVYKLTRLRHRLIVTLHYQIQQTSPWHSLTPSISRPCLVVRPLKPFEMATSASRISTFPRATAQTCAPTSTCPQTLPCFAFPCS